MQIRYLKILLVVFVALLGLFYAIQNVVNLDEAYGFVAYVVGMENNEAYPSAMGLAFHSPLLIWMTLAIIILGESATGLLAAKGAWDLWTSRKAPAAEFNASKTYAVLGCGAAVVVWFGLFIVVGGAIFQMWQHELGAASIEGAFQAAGASGIVLLFVNAADD